MTSWAASLLFSANVTGRRLRSRDLVLVAAVAIVAAVAAGVVARLAIRGNGEPSSTPAPVTVAEPDAGVRDAGRPDARAALPSRSPDAALDSATAAEPTTLAEQRAALLETLRTELDASDDELARVRAIFDASPIIGQGNPKLTVHPMTRAECRAIRASARLFDPDPSLCGEANMVPIYGGDAAPRDAHVCIDQYEFPNVPCEYPLVHVSAREAALLCEALGKRLCDTHEWEGACAGELSPLDRDYTWKHSRATRALYHNRDRARSWAYGSTKDHTRCATDSTKSRSCTEGGYRDCGSNTYPAGAFPECMSRFGVYDQHGNAAEHMNIPLEVSELTSRGGSGYTEMKGSWFFFQKQEAHEDDCRWRAPSWHSTKVMAVDSHSNYHLGFRCCKSLEQNAR